MSTCAPRIIGRRIAAGRSLSRRQLTPRLAVLLCALWGCTTAPAVPASDGDGEDVLPDLAGEPATCALPSGRPCDRTLGCADEGGCNWCGCMADGTIGCLLVGCERGRIRCQSAADCPARETCLFDPGCDGAPGTCFRGSYDFCKFIGGGGITATPAQGSVTVCSCDGRTVTVPATCGAERPYRNAGPCR